MSLARPNLMEMVKKQYVYKLSAYLDLYNRLVFLQILGILLSLSGVGGGGGGGNSEVNVNFYFYSADIVVGFSILWSFITAIIITTKPIQNGDFLFVTNRISSNLSNLFYLLTSCLIGAITAMLSSYLLKAIIYYFMGRHYVDIKGPMNAPTELLLGIFTTTLYLILFCSFGYFAGILARLRKGFIVVLLAVLIGTLFWGKGSIIAIIFEFFFMESSLLLFLTKVVVTVVLLFACSIVLSNRMEVKQ